MAWKRQFPSDGMLTARTCSPESVIFCSNLSSCRKMSLRSEIESRMAEAMSVSKYSCVEFVSGT